MLPGLGHDPLVSRDHERHHVDAGCPGHHVFDEFLVARDVHDAEDLAAGERQMGKSQFNGDPALFLLLEAVCVDAGERFDEGGLSMVDVAGRAEDVLSHKWRLRVSFPKWQSIKVNRGNTAWCQVDRPQVQAPQKPY